MDTQDKVYRKLQQHLDRQPIGFPATRSGAELRVLKHLFSPREAAVAARLSYRPQPLDVLFAASGDLVDSPEELAAILDSIQRKGGIETVEQNNATCYCNSPLVVGMYEMQVGRLTPEFIRDFKDYSSTREFGISFLGSEVPQMRIIPVSRSIHPQQSISSYDEIRAIMAVNPGPFAVMDCICRKKSALAGSPCAVTDREETCLGMGSVVETVIKSGSGREISRSDALAILEENQKQGLVLQPSNTEAVEFICSCCGCCCGMLSIHKSLPKPNDFWASNFYAAVDGGACIGCGICEKRCHVGAVKLPGKKEAAVVDLNRCLGCGVCVPTCPEEAIALVKKPVETVPPKTRHDLHEKIMARKKGKLGKVKLTGKLLVDTLTTGQGTLLK